MHDENTPSPKPRPDSLPGSPPDPLPDALRNWQVLEIDSQATPVSDAMPGAAAEAAPESPNEETDAKPEDVRDLQISDRQDEVIVAALDSRRRTVECGGTVHYAVSVLNNGAQVATFQVQIEGWIDPQWVGDATPALTLEPGRRGTLRLPLAPPRRAGSEAGDYHFAVTVRSPQYAGRLARLGALLTVLPFDAVEARFVELPEAAVSWLHRTAALPLTVTNLGNHPAQIALHGVDPDEECRFAFPAPPISGMSQEREGRSGDAGVLTLQPNQAVTFPVRVEVRRPPLIGLRGREVPVQVEAQANGHTAAVAGTQLIARPLVGPWQMAAAMGLAAAGAVGLLLVLALVFVLTQRSALLQTAPQTAEAAPAVPAAVPPPVIILTLNQPAGAPAVQGAAAQGANLGTSDFTTGASPDPGLPLVLPDQVSAPDGTVYAPAPAVAASSAGAAVESGGALPSVSGAADGGASGAASSSAGSTANQTYGEMFQSAGRQFDLDWRLLAAQAYVESGFDSLALSDSGAMGLMQVQPDTWREWATAVEVSDPFDAYSSVQVAAAYLDYLRSKLAAQGYPETQWMLVAYNWGPDRLDDFLAGGGTWDTLPEMRRQYAGEILRIAKSIP